MFYNGSKFMVGNYVQNGSDIIQYLTVVLSPDVGFKSSNKGANAGATDSCKKSPHQETFYKG